MYAIEDDVWKNHNSAVQRSVSRLKFYLSVDKIWKSDSDRVLFVLNESGKLYRRRISELWGNGYSTVTSKAAEGNTTPALQSGWFTVVIAVCSAREMTLLVVGSWTRARDGWRGQFRRLVLVRADKEPTNCSQSERRGRRLSRPSCLAPLWVWNRYKRRGAGTDDFEERHSYFAACRLNAESDPTKCCKLAHQHQRQFYKQWPFFELWPRQKTAYGACDNLPCRRDLQSILLFHCVWRMCECFQRYYAMPLISGGITIQYNTIQYIVIQ